VRRDRQVATSVRGRVGRACLAALFVPPFLLIGASAVFGAPQDGVAPVAKWRAFSSSAGVADGLMALDVKGRTGFAFSSDSSGAPFSVRAWHLDTLRPRGAAAAGPAGAQVKSQTPYAVDEANHTVYVAPAAGIGGTPRVIAVGLRDGVAKVIGTMTPRFPAGYYVAGLAADSAHGRLFLLGAPTADAAFVRPATSAVQVDAWKLADASAARVTGEIAQPAAVPSSCGQPVTSRFPAALMPSADGRSVTFGCLGTRGTVSDLASSPNDIAGAARFEVVTSAPTHAFTLYPIYGTFGTGDSFAVAGSWFAMNSGGAGQTNLKIFDIRVNRWVGNVAYSSTLFSVAGDSALGRGYVVVTDGFASLELNAVPVTQLRMVPSLAARIGPQQRVMAVDPRTHRVFVPVSDDVVNGPNAYLLVVRDVRPRLDPSVDDDPDGGSLRTREVPGKIDSARTAFANAVGAEYRKVGGTDGPCTNTIHIQWNGTCDPGTRYYQFAASRNVSVDNEHATAEAVNMRIDDTTQGDTAKATGVGEEPPAPPVLCQDLDGTATNGTGDNATTQCDTTKQAASASSAASPPRMLLAARADDPLPEAVQVRNATSTAKTERLPDGTTVSTATAVAHGVDILGVVQIGTVTATATTSTHGQPGSAKATYTTTLQDVTINGQQVCNLTCRAGDVGAQINDAFDGRVQVSFSDAKKVTFASPGGVTARVAVDRYEHAEDQLVNDEAASSVITPAMKIVVYGDGAIAQREIVRLALVSVSQQYRVVPLDVDVPITSPGPPGPPGAPVTVPGQPGTTITTGGTVGGGGTSDTPPTSLGNEGSGGGVFAGLINGLRVVLRSPNEVAGIACVWMLLALPAYLAARRRLLLELPRLRVQEDV
jgi:hypothetical protein